MKECKFDRNEFGQFLGSATVVYEKQEDAEKAIEEYHGAYLDDKLLTVEFEAPRVHKEKLTISKSGGRGGKTLRLGRR